MTKINDVEANLEQFKSETLAWQKETSNRFDRMQESIDKNKADADKQFAELLQLLKALQPPTIHQISAAKTYNLNEKVKTARVNNVTTAGPKAVVSAVVGYRENVVKSLACWIWRPTGNVIDYTSKDSGSYMFKRFDYVDLQGRLKDLKAYDWQQVLSTDYQSVDGRICAFAGSPKGGKIY
ncbi:hypothetical protein Tco_0532009 [Tanacetum coccineum]